MPRNRDPANYAVIEATEHRVSDDARQEANRNNYSPQREITDYLDNHIPDHKMMERMDYFEVDQVMDQLRDKAAEFTDPDQKQAFCEAAANHIIPERDDYLSNDRATAAFAKALEHGENAQTLSFYYAQATDFAPGDITDPRALAGMEFANAESKAVCDDFVNDKLWEEINEYAAGNDPARAMIDAAMTRTLANLNGSESYDDVRYIQRYATILNYRLAAGEGMIDEPGYTPPQRPDDENLTPDAADEFANQADRILASYGSALDDGADDVIAAMHAETVAELKEGVHDAAEHLRQLEDLASQFREVNTMDTELGIARRNMVKSVHAFDYAIQPRYPGYESQAMAA